MEINVARFQLAFAGSCMFQWKLFFLYEQRDEAQKEEEELRKQATR